MADDVVETPYVDDPGPESVPESIESRLAANGSADQSATRDRPFADPVAGTQRPAQRRASRFDRPREPHDWRWVLGIVGRTLVSLGVLMFAFVAYQLWGTGIQTAIEQDRLGDRFDQMLETTVPVTTVPPATTVQPVTSAAPTESTTSTIAPTTTVPAAVVPIPTEGEPVARLNIPAMDLNDWEVVEGVSPNDLRNGPGHFPETPLPGQLGNSAIAGHRTTHGAPFGKINDLQAGDDIMVTTLAGQYTYVVTGKTIVDPGDYSLVIPTVDPTKATLTLTSCHPAYSTRQRLVVFAELDIARSSPVTLPAADLGAQDPSTLPAESVPAESVPATAEPVQTLSVETVPPPGTPAATDPSSTQPATTETATSEPAVVADVEPPDQSADAFANRWFGDSAAFPQVALWGFLLVLVAFGAHAVSRRARRNWVGLLVGVVPFIVVLYFWFENINRLLPPNL